MFSSSPPADQYAARQPPLDPAANGKISRQPVARKADHFNKQKDCLVIIVIINVKESSSWLMFRARERGVGEGHERMARFGEEQVRYSTLSWQVTITGRPNPFGQAEPINSTSFWPLPSLPCPVTSCWHSSWGSSGWFRYFRIWWYFKWSSVTKTWKIKSRSGPGASFLNHFRSKQWQQCSVWSSWRAKTHTFSPSKHCNSFSIADYHHDIKENMILTSLWNASRQDWTCWRFAQHAPICEQRYFFIFIVTILYVCYYYDANNHYLIITFQVPVVRVEICFESLTKISGQGRLGAPQVQVILMMVGISVVLA